MKALVSPVESARLAGIAHLIGAIPLLGLALVYERVPLAIFDVVFATTFMSAWTFTLVHRRQARRGILHLRPAPDPPRQPRRELLRTIAIVATIQTILYLAVAGGCQLLPWYDDGPAFSLLAGLAAGPALSGLLLSRWLRRWELEHDDQLLVDAVKLSWPWRRARPKGGLRVPFTYYGATIADGVPAEDVVYSP
jgi:hypothetical protein